MTQDDKRLKEINHRRWEIAETFKELKKELQNLSIEEAQITGYHRIEKSRQAYRHKGKVRVKK